MKKIIIILFAVILIFLGYQVVSKFYLEQPGAFNVLNKSGGPVNMIVGINPELLGLKKKEPVLAIKDNEEKKFKVKHSVDGRNSVFIRIQSVNNSREYVFFSLINKKGKLEITRYMGSKNIAFKKAKNSSTWVFKKVS